MSSEKREGRRSELAYKALKERICRGDYLPGFRLVESDLTQEYSVSRTTIREALRRLLADELVELIPHVGARVRRLTVRDVLEIFVVRTPLEGIAARLAARAAADAKARLDSIQAALADSIGVDDRLGFARFNVRFHMAVAELSENRALMAVLARLNTQLIGFQFLPGFKAVNRERALHDHGVVIEKIIAGDGEAAEAAMRRHLETSLASILPIVHQEVGEGRTA